MSTRKMKIGEARRRRTNTVLSVAVVLEVLAIAKERIPLIGWIALGTAARAAIVTGARATSAARSGLAAGSS